MSWFFVVVAVVKAEEHGERENYKNQQRNKEMEGAHRTVCGFWWVNGRRLESENGPGTFKYELVQKMGDLHGDIVGLMDQVCGEEGTIRGKIQEIVRLQRRHLMQFEFCLDEFNRYLSALQLLDVMLCKTQGLLSSFV